MTDLHVTKQIVSEQIAFWRSCRDVTIGEVMRSLGYAPGSCRGSTWRDLEKILVREWIDLQRVKSYLALDAITAGD